MCELRRVVHSLGQHSSLSRRVFVKSFAGGYRLRVLDRRIENTRLVDYFGSEAAELTDSDKVKLGEMTFGSLSADDSKVLLFPPGVGPFTRALSFMSRLHIRWCKQARMVVNIDPASVTYGTPGKYKEVVEEWFRRNDERDARRLEVATTRSGTSAGGDSGVGGGTEEEGS